MRIYSPSQTESHILCPMLRVLQQEGWRRATIGRKELGGLLGSAVGVGMNTYNAFRLAGQTVSPSGLGIPTSSCVRTALDSLREDKEDLLASGQKIGDWDVAQWNALEARVTRGVTKAIEQDPLPPDWRILDVEYEIPDSGRSRIDLAVHDGAGPMVIDYKTKLTLDAKYRDKEIARYRRSWQMFHYVYFYGKHAGVAIQRYGIVLIVLEPRFSIELLTFSVDPIVLQRWEQFARLAWQEMAVTEGEHNPVRGQTKCRDEYGECEMVMGCWEYNLEEDLMAREYVKVAR